MLTSCSYLENLALQQGVRLIEVIAVELVGQLQLLEFVVDLFLLPETVITVPAIGCLAIGIDALVLELPGELKEAFLVENHAKVLIQETVELQASLAAESSIEPAVRTIGKRNTQPAGDEHIEAGGIFMFLGIELDLLEEIIFVLEVNSG